MLDQPVMPNQGEIMLSKVPESHNIMENVAFNIKLQQYFKNFVAVCFH